MNIKYPYKLQFRIIVKRYKLRNLNELLFTKLKNQYLNTKNLNFKYHLNANIIISLLNKKRKNCSKMFRFKDLGIQKDLSVIELYTR